MKTPSCDDAVDVGMKEQGLGPGVQHRGEADLGSQVAGPEGHLPESLSHGGKKQSVGLLGRSAKKGVKETRKGEDDMVVLDGQQVLLLRLQPPGWSRPGSGHLRSRHEL